MRITLALSAAFILILDPVRAQVIVPPISVPITNSDVLPSLVVPEPAPAVTPPSTPTPAPAPVVVDLPAPASPPPPAPAPVPVVNPPAPVVNPPKDNSPPPSSNPSASNPQQQVFNKPASDGNIRQSQQQAPVVKSQSKTTSTSALSPAAVVAGSKNGTSSNVNYDANNNAGAYHSTSTTSPTTVALGVVGAILGTVCILGACVGYIRRKQRRQKTSVRRSQLSDVWDFSKVTNSRNASNSPSIASRKTDSTARATMIVSTSHLPTVDHFDGPAQRDGLMYQQVFESTSSNL